MDQLTIVIPYLSETEYQEIIKCKKAVSNQWRDGLNISIIEEKGSSYPQIFNNSIKKLKEGFVLFIFPWVILKDKAFEELSFEDKDGQAFDLQILSYEKISWNEPSSITLENRISTRDEFALELHEHPGDITYTAVWNKILSVDVILRNQLLFNTDLKESYEYDFLLNYLNHSKLVKLYNTQFATFYTQPAPDISVKERIIEKKYTFSSYEKLLASIKDQETARDYIDQERLGYLIYEKSRIFNLPANERAEVKKLLKEIRLELKNHSFILDLYILIKSIKGNIGSVKQKLITNKHRTSKTREVEKRAAKEQFWHDHFYQIRKPLRKVHGFISKKKNILLYCESNTMKPHIMDYYECVKGRSGIRLYIYYPNMWCDEVPGGVKLVKTFFGALFKPWDLVVCADAKAPLYYNRNYEKIIYINHGLHMISYDGGKTLYAYQEGLGSFSAMLEPNKRYAEIMSAEYPDESIYYTGYKNAESIIEQGNRKAAFRDELGVDDNCKLIAAFGTWGADSLFHSVGDSLISQAKELMNDGYKFILSIHPKEYSKYDQTLEPLGDYIESLAEAGFIIRNPKEPSLKYMSAADVVICDYSTLCEEAMLTGKPVILSEFPADRVWKDSIIAKYKDKCPSFSNDSNLRELMERVETDSELISYAQNLVNDLLPPKEGYKETIWKVTKNVLG